MTPHVSFHGSDIEAASAYYHIPQEQITCFSANVNPLGLSKALKEKLAQNLDVLSSYPDRNYTALKSAIGTYCQISPEHILVGNGSTEMISVLIHTRCPANALMLAPTYSEYKRELSLVGCSLEEYVLDETRNFQLDVADFCQKIKKDKYDLIIICNPNNPTSSALATDEIRQILISARENDCFMMIDETYVEFAPDIRKISAMSLIAEFDNLIILRGVSKFYAAPGLRLGYAATSNGSLLKAFAEQQNPWSLNSLGALAGEYMFSDTSYIEETRCYINEERTRMYHYLSEFPQLKLYEPYANFILVKMQIPDVTSYSLFDALMHQGLMVRDCTSFECLNGEFFRFCIMKKADNTRLLEAIKTFIEEKSSKI